MKKLTLTLILLLLFTVPVSFADYGASAAQNDDDLTLKDMLTYAIQDEYLARAEYNLIMQTFDVTRPFSNIERAENMHIDWLTELFATYKYTLPKDEANVPAPATLTEAFSAGVLAEKVNIEMYETFLAQELPEDVRAVFEALKTSSENHLRAFERNGSQERIPFRGRGWGRKGAPWQN